MGMPDGARFLAALGMTVSGAALFSKAVTPNRLALSIAEGGEEFTPVTQDKIPRCARNDGFGRGVVFLDCHSEYRHSAVGAIQREMTE